MQKKDYHKIIIYFFQQELTLFTTIVFTYTTIITVSDIDWFWYFSIIIAISSFITSIVINISIIKWVHFFSELIKNKKKILRVFKNTIWLNGFTVLFWPFFIKKLLNQNKELLTTPNSEDATNELQ